MTGGIPSGPIGPMGPSGPPMGNWNKNNTGHVFAGTADEEQTHSFFEILTQDCWEAKKDGLTPGPIGPIPGFIPMYIFVSPELVESEK